MESTKTNGFLKTAEVAVIACADGKILQNFFDFTSGCTNDFVIAECERYDCIDITDGQKWQTVDKIVALKHSAKRSSAFGVLPIELLNCEEHLLTARLRALYFRIPESSKGNIQIFKLHYYASELRLECEFGENAGRYIVYDYDAAVGRFKEKE